MWKQMEGTRMDKFVNTAAFSLRLVADWLKQHQRTGSPTERDELVQKSLEHIAVLENLAAEILNEREPRTDVDHCSSQPTESNNPP
jgi:hypothetical protein